MTEPDYTAEASSSESLAGSGPSSSSGAFITNCQNFTIADSHFTNVIHCAPAILSDFRTIPLGDLDLRNEIRLDDSGVAGRHHGVRRVRRMYTARIEGKQSGMTAAIYEGEHAEESFAKTWRHELSKYSGFRHPNFVQLYGTVNSGGLYATIFHDDLVPAQQFLEEHRHSVISTVYLYHCFNTELSDANEYFRWRGSSYAACCDFPLLMHLLTLHPQFIWQKSIPWDTGWRRYYYGPMEDATVMENGWSRIHSSCINIPIVRILSTNAKKPCEDSWLSQANHVFSQLAIPPKHEDCFLVHYVQYRLRLSGPLENLLEGYLFLCPLEDLRSNDGTWLVTTECPAYWSLNSSGGHRLCPEDASNLGFPSLEFTMQAEVSSWPENVYAALSRFHAGKGFDPNSQDIARHLGHPTLELSCNSNVESAHIEEVSPHSLEPQLDPALASHDASFTQRFRLMIGGVLGLIMALVVTWSYCK
ncbi:hypothetical protein C8R44DRAFT_886905 [Mycena epipterygia]|nr:hypothetical protein C8R44DRAFT_886905 [Mycena epipterygia]